MLVRMLGVICKKNIFFSKLSLKLVLYIGMRKVRAMV